MRPAPTETEIACFWSYVDKGDGTGCYLWTGAIDVRGYGQFNWGGKIGLAHRFSYMAVKGPIPSSVYVLHRCDTPPCVRFEHFFPGDAAANMQDCLSKGRYPTGDQHYTRRRPDLVRRGENNTQAKLTEANAIEILELVASRSVTQRALAERFGVNQSVISQIVNGKRWKHLQRHQHQQEQQGDQ